MATQNPVFSGSIPAIYDRFMVPLIFAPYAEEVARRAKSIMPGHVLETAAGTGVVTEALHRALPDAEIIATDLNEPMIEQAARRVRSDAVSFEVADAQELRFADESFDLVVCQFGVMFFPDKVRGNAEARRVLRDGGRYLLVIWDKVERNLATMAAGRAVAELIPGEAETIREAARLKGLEPQRGIGPLPDDLLRVRGGDLLDVHRGEEGGAEHEHFGPQQEAAAVARDIAEMDQCVEAAPRHGRAEPGRRGDLRQLHLRPALVEGAQHGKAALERGEIL